MADGFSGKLGKLAIVDDVTDPEDPAVVVIEDAQGWANNRQVDTLPATVFGDQGWQDVEAGVRKADLSYTVKVTADVAAVLETVLIEGRKVTHHLYRQRTDTKAWVQKYMIQTYNDQVQVTGLVMVAVTATSCHSGASQTPPAP